MSESPSLPPPLPLLPKTPPRTLALTPKVVNTTVNPIAYAIVGNIVFLSFRSLAALEMYDIVMGNNPKEHGLKEVMNPAAYSISSDFIDSIEENSIEILLLVVVVVVVALDGLSTVLASENPAFSALNIISSSPK